jgi:L-asparaginase II/alkylhydroperoxidase/carboxymuconolactone decarboxylase family protein YurZ
MNGRIRVSRGDLVESEHRVHAVVAGPSGPEFTIGDARFPTTLRSVAKLFQALPLVEDGVADALGLPEEELALCCASHNSEPAHVDAARAILARAGLTEAHLACGPHPPMDAAAGRALIDAGVDPGPIHNNCSGKHAGMLALAAHHGWETDGYHLPEHPVQRRMAAEIARWSGLDAASIPTGVDGCGIPCYGVPLDRLAEAFRRFVADPSDAPARLLGAVARHPFMIGGSDRLCTRLPEVTGGRIVAKIGAEGVYGAVDRAAGRGIAVKVEDGARRAVEPALMGVLEAVGALSEGEIRALEAYRAPQVRNTRRDAVGRIEFVLRADTVGPGAADVAATDAVRWDRGLSALVEVSAAIAGGDEATLQAALESAVADADPLEVEEAILQSYLFLGFPAALNAFATWRTVSGTEAPASPDPDVGADVDPQAAIEAWSERGARTCARVYGRAYQPLRENIASLKPELDRWMILEGYGKVLARPGLSLGRRECCISAILAVRGLPVQLRSHMRGALRCGATPDMLDRILALVEPLATDVALQRARRVRDAVVSASEE